MYRVREVDGFDDEIADTLKWLHDTTFLGTAPAVDTDEGFWWLVYCGKEPIGFAGMTRANTARPAGYLKRSGILPEHRGSRLQFRLIRAREAKARKNGWELMITDTTDNVRSANTLIRAGYKLYDPAHPWAFENSLYWEKELHG